MNQFCVINCPGPEHGVFSIYIFDLISRSDLVVFSLIRARNYHYNKGHVCYVFPFYIQYRYGNLSILFLILLLGRYTYVGIFASTVHWNTMILFFSWYFILSCHGTLLFSKILNLLFYGIFEHRFYTADKEMYNLRFLIIINKCINQVPIAQTKQPQKEGALPGTSWLLWDRSWLRHKLPGFR